MIVGAMEFSKTPRNFGMSIYKNRFINLLLEH